jgi:hypothetical protein
VHTWETYTQQKHNALTIFQCFIALCDTNTYYTTHLPKHIQPTIYEPEP